MDILKAFSGLGRRRGIIPAIASAALISVTLVSVLLLSCRKGVGAGPGEDISGVFAVQGVVSNVITGGPLSGAVVTLMQHGEPVKTTQTSVDGAYFFTGIEASAGYTVTASASIYLESASLEFAVAGDHSVGDITLDRRWPSEGTVVTSSIVNVYGIAVAPDGTIYVNESFYHRIRQIAPDGTVTAYAGTGSSGVADGSTASATFRRPEGIAVSTDGTGVYVADYEGHSVRHITGGWVWTIAGSGSDGGFSGDNGDAILAQLDGPRSVAVDAAGNVYIADYRNGRIRKISATDNTISTIAGGGGQTEDEGNALSAQLAGPRSIAVDMQGNVYFSESHRVRKITGGMISTVFGTTDPQTDMTGLRNPWGIAVDAAGTVYVADSSNNRIVKVTADGIPSVLAGNDGGQGNEQLSSPSDVAIGPDGCIYIALSGFSQQRILKY